MFKRLYIIALLCFAIPGKEINAQFGIQKYLSSHQSSLGGNTTLLSGVYSFQGNPAGLADNDDRLSLIANTEQRFFLSSLNSSFVGAIAQIGAYDYVAISAANFGIEEYKEQKFSTAYSRRIGEKTFIGSTFNLFNFQIQEYGSKAWFNLDIGIKTAVSKVFLVGVVVENLFPDRLTDNSDQPLRVAVGIQYILSNKVFVVSEARKASDDKISFSFGINYSVLNNLSFQAGINGLESGPTFGFLYKIKEDLHFSGGIRSGQNLGLTPNIGLVLKFS